MRRIQARLQRLQLHQTTGRNLVPQLVSGASVQGLWESFYTQLGQYIVLFCLSFSILVTEDSHSRMGGSDVVNW